MLKSSPVAHPHRAGRFIQQTTGYKAFIPAPLPPEPLIDCSGPLQTLLSEADRNLDSDPVAAFWLPTSFGRFCPDFVCELTDGRLLVVEYKGAQIASMPKEIEKGEVGRLWATRSQGRCAFVMVFKEHGGLGVGQQIDAAVNARG